MRSLLLLTLVSLASVAMAAPMWPYGQQYEQDVMMPRPHGEEWGMDSYLDPYSFSIQQEGDMDIRPIDRDPAMQVKCPAGTNGLSIPPNHIRFWKSLPLTHKLKWSVVKVGAGKGVGEVETVSWMCVPVSLRPKLTPIIAKMKTRKIMESDPLTIPGFMKEVKKIESVKEVKPIDEMEEMEALRRMHIMRQMGLDVEAESYPGRDFDFETDQVVYPGGWTGRWGGALTTPIRGGLYPGYGYGFGYGGNVLAQPGMVQPRLGTPLTYPISTPMTQPIYPNMPASNQFPSDNMEDMEEIDPSAFDSESFETQQVIGGLGGNWGVGGNWGNTLGSPLGGRYGGGFGGQYPGFGRYGGQYPNTGRFGLGYGRGNVMNPRVGSPFISGANVPTFTSSASSFSYPVQIGSQPHTITTPLRY